MKKWITIGLSVVIVLIGSLMVVKKVSPLGWGWWGTYNTASGVALSGYDPVTSFTSGQPAPGNADYSYEWRDATWQFASARNMAMFADDPVAYAPRFGGFCTFAVSKGVTADISPEAWHLEDGNLYVFADKNVRDEWVAGLGEGSLEKSTANWAKR